MSLAHRPEFYDAPGKREVRERWYEAVQGLAKALGRKLDVLWLADDALSDLRPVMPMTQYVLVPEKHRANYKKKLRAVSSSSWIWGERTYVHYGDVFQLAGELNKEFDLVNLDLCSSLSTQIYHQIAGFVRSPVLRSHSVLLLTLPQITPAVLNKEWFHLQARSSGDVRFFIEATLQNAHLQFQELFNLEYPSGGRRIFALAWELRRIVSKLSLGERARNMIEAGFDSEFIAAKLGITVKSVGAYRANMSRPAKKGRKNNV